MTVKELMERLESLPENMQVAVPVPEYWEGGTDYELVTDVRQGETAVAYPCKCGHLQEEHQGINPRTQAPWKFCSKCECKLYEQDQVILPVVIVTSERS